MTTLANTNISADGIRDVMEDLSSNGGGDSVAINNSYISDRFAFINGSANTSNTTSDTATKQYADAKQTFAVKAGSANWTVGSSKGSTTYSVVGWGTTGGVQGATNNGSTTQIGTLYDGTSALTSSAMPVSSISSGFESNKWLSFVGYSGAVTVGFYFYICFEGSNAGTGDSDWSTVTLKGDWTGSIGATDMSGGTAGINLARSSATVLSQYSRICYRWSLSLLDIQSYMGVASSGNDVNMFVSLR